jgi:U3 small nucleolar RNA-associated protein 22
MPTFQLKHDAKKTLEYLDDKISVSRDPFTEVFLKEQRDLPARFDTVIRFVLP